MERVKKRYPNSPFSPTPALRLPGVRGHTLLAGKIVLLRRTNSAQMSARRVWELAKSSAVPARIYGKVPEIIKYG